MARILHPSSGEILTTADGTNTISGIVSTAGAALNVNVHSGATTGARKAGFTASPHLNTQEDLAITDIGNDLLLAGDTIQLHTAATDGESYDAVISKITQNSISVELEDVAEALSFTGSTDADTGVVVAAGDGTIVNINLTTVSSNEPPADLTGDEVVDLFITFTTAGPATVTETVTSVDGFDRIEYSVSNDRIVIYFTGADAVAHAAAFVARYDGSTQATGGAATGTNIDVVIHYHDNDALTHYSYDVERNFGYASYTSTNFVPFTFADGTFISAPADKIIYLT